MTDKEALDLIAYYAWHVVWMGNSSRCVIVTRGGSTEPQENIRQAIKDAAALQVKWATAA